MTTESESTSARQSLDPRWNDQQRAIVNRLPQGSSSQPAKVSSSAPGAGLTLEEQSQIKRELGIAGGDASFEGHSQGGMDVLNWAYGMAEEYKREGMERPSFEAYAITPPGAGSSPGGRVPEDSPRGRDFESQHGRIPQERPTAPGRGQVQVQVQQPLGAMGDVSTKKQLDKALGELNRISRRTSNPQTLQAARDMETKVATRLNNLEVEQAEATAKLLEKETTARDVLRKSQRLGEQKVLDSIQTINQRILEHEIDPRRAFKSTWQIIGAAVASAAGAFASGLHSRGIPNTAMLLIEQAISRDIKAQKADLAKLGSLVNMKQNVYANLRRDNVAELDAADRAAIVARQNALIPLAKIAAETKNLKVKATAERLKRELELKNADAIRKQQMDAKTEEVKAYLELLKMQSRGSLRVGGSHAVDLDKLNKKFDMFDELLLSIDTGEGLWKFSDKSTEQVYTLLHENLREAPLVFSWMSKLASEKLSPLVAGADPEGLERMQNYTSWGLLLVTELAKSYQGKHLSDRDMKSYLAVLPDMSLLGTKEGIELARARMKSLRAFFASDEYGSASPEERGHMMFNYAIEGGYATPGMYQENYEFDSPGKQIIYDTAKLSREIEGRQRRGVPQ